MDWNHVAADPASEVLRFLGRVLSKEFLSRVTGDILALAPAMIADKTHIDQLVETLGRVIRGTN